MHVDVHGGLFREITCQTRHAILRSTHDHEHDVQSRDPEDPSAAAVQGRLEGNFFEFFLFLLHIHSSGNFIAAATS